MPIRKIVLETKYVNTISDDSYGFAWQAFGSERTKGVASVRSCEKLPLCLIKPVPAGSKTDPPLPKAKPIRDGGSISVIIYLRRGRKEELW